MEDWKKRLNGTEDSLNDYSAETNDSSYCTG